MITQTSDWESRSLSFRVYEMKQPGKKRWLAWLNRRQKSTADASCVTA